MNRVRFYFCAIFFCLLLSGFSAKAQVPELINDSEFRPTAKAAADSVYNFKFEAADNILRPWKERYPDHPIWTLFEGIKFWWEVLSDLEDTSNDEQFYYLMKKADYESGKLLREKSSHADGLIIKAISNGFLARQHANREGWITSLNYGRKAMNAHEYLMEVQPDLADLKLAEGLKLYYLDYLPEAYPIVKTVTWTLPNGDKERGLELLEEASQTAIFAAAEATYFLGNINYNYEKNYDKAARYFIRLYQQYPNNNYYARLLVKSYYRMNHYDDALAVIDSTLLRWERNSLPHKDVLEEELFTWKGRILEHKNENAEALKCFRQAFELGKKLPKTQTRSFHVIAGYHAGKLYYEQKKFREAESILRQVVDAKAESSYRRQARRLLSEIR